MNEQNKELEQQILFEEIKEHEVPSLMTPVEQVVVDNDSWQELPDVDDEIEIEEEPIKKTGWLTKVFLFTFLCLITVELIQFFVVGFESSPITTTLYAIVTTCIGIIAGSSLIKEVRGLKQYKRCIKTQLEIENIIQRKSDADLTEMLKQFTKSLPIDLDSKQQNSWNQAVL